MPEGAARVTALNVSRPEVWGRPLLRLNINQPLMMLFTAKWNVPQAAEALGLPACNDSWDEVREMFRDFCKDHPPVHRFTGGDGML